METHVLINPPRPVVAQAHGWVVLPDNVRSEMKYEDQPTCEEEADLGIPAWKVHNEFFASTDRILVSILGHSSTRVHMYRRIPAVPPTHRLDDGKT